MPSVGGDAASDVFPGVRGIVFMKQQWGSKWLFQPYVEPSGYVYSAAPEVSRGDLIYHFGYLNREDKIESTPFPLYKPYAAGPWYVLIATQIVTHGPTFATSAWNSGTPTDFHFAGILSEDEVTVDRPAFPSGRQNLTVFGFEHLLDRAFITRSFVKQTYLFGGQIEGTIDHVLPFNERHERGGSVVGNQSGLRDSAGVYRFWDPDDGSEPGRWTNLEICEYLLQHFVNILPDGTPSPIKFIMAGQTNALQQIIDTYDFRPTEKAFSVWHALNQLIDRRRGLGFVLRSSLQPGAPVYVWVFSLVESPISAGDTVLPPNSEQISFSIPATYPYNNLVGEIPFRYSATNLFDSIEVQSERIRVCGSWRIRDLSIMHEGWSTSEQTAYEHAPDDESRATDRFRPVYSYFKVNPHWDWKVTDAAGHEFNLLLKPNNDGTVSTDRNTSLVGYNAQKTFERDLPLLEGWNYRLVPPVNNNPPGTQPEYVKLVCLLPLESPTPPLDHTDPNAKYYFAEKGSEQIDFDVPSCSVRALDHGMGVEIHASPNYLIAKNRFNPVAGSNDEDPQVDYKDMVITASVYSDVRAHVFLKGISTPKSELKPRLIVELQDCHYWYVAPFTQYDIQDDGSNLPQFVSAGNEVVRDDTSRLRQVAAYLRWWFSRLRQAVMIRIFWPGKWAQPGQLLTQINTSWSREPINAVITSRKVSFNNGTTELITSYLDLDTMVSLLDDPQRRTKGVAAIHDARR